MNYQRAEEILDNHCTTVYNKNTGEEEIESLKSAVMIAMEEFAKEYHTEQLCTVNPKHLFCDHCKKRKRTKGDGTIEPLCEC